MEKTKILAVRTMRSVEALLMLGTMVDTRHPFSVGLVHWGYQIYPSREMTQNLCSLCTDMLSTVTEFFCNT